MIKTLRQALEPFARVGNLYIMHSLTDNSPWVDVPDGMAIFDLPNTDCRITILDLRAAAMSLAHAESPPTNEAQDRIDDNLDPLPEPILQFFEYDHLPAKLQAVSCPFRELALYVIETCPRNPERTVALRKLLESKDAAVRAAISR